MGVRLAHRGGAPAAKWKPPSPLLPDRYLGAEPWFDATFQIRLVTSGEHGRSGRGGRCEVRPSSVHEPDVVIGSDAATWLALREGRLSGLDAFTERRLYTRGDLDLALGFKGLLRLPGGRPPLLRVLEDGRVRRNDLEPGPGEGVRTRGAAYTDSARTRPPSSRRSPRSAPITPSTRSTCRASAPRRSRRGAPTTPPTSPARRSRYMDAMGIERAHLVGNSMGGRVAIELALAHPDRARRLSLLCAGARVSRRNASWCRW